MELKELFNQLCLIFQPVFYVSDDELSPQNMPDASDEVDKCASVSAVTSGNAYFMPNAMDDSNGSLNGRFDRQVQVKSSRVYSSHKSRRKDRSRSKTRHRSGGHLEEESLVSEYTYKVAALVPDS